MPYFYLKLKKRKTKGNYSTVQKDSEIVQMFLKVFLCSPKLNVFDVGVCTNSRTFEYLVSNYYSNNKNTIQILLCVNLLAVNAGNP